MLDVRITQQFAKIGLEIQNARYELNKKKPDMTIKQVPAEVEIETTWPEVTVDYTAMRESLGVGGMLFVTESFVAASREQYHENLEKSVQVSNLFGDIKNGLSVGEIISRSLIPRDPYIELVSLAPVDIAYTPATVESQARLGGVEMQVDFGKVSIEGFTFPSIHAYLEQEPYLKIDTVGQVFDQRK